MWKRGERNLSGHESRIFIMFQPIFLYYLFKVSCNQNTPSKETKRVHCICVPTSESVNYKLKMFQFDDNEKCMGFVSVENKQAKKK